MRELHVVLGAGQVGPLVAKALVECGHRSRRERRGVRGPRHRWSSERLPLRQSPLLRVAKAPAPHDPRHRGRNAAEWREPPSARQPLHAYPMWPQASWRSEPRRRPMASTCCPCSPPRRRARGHRACLPRARQPYAVDDERIRRELGLSPTPWDEAIDATVAWGRAAFSTTNLS